MMTCHFALPRLDSSSAPISACRLAAITTRAEAEALGDDGTNVVRKVAEIKGIVSTTKCAVAPAHAADALAGRPQRPRRQSTRHSSRRARPSPRARRTLAPRARAVVVLRRPIIMQAHQRD